MNLSILDGRGKIWDQKVREERYHKTFSGWEQAPQLSQIIWFVFSPSRKEAAVLGQTQKATLLKEMVNKSRGGDSQDRLKAGLGSLT